MKRIVLVLTLLLFGSVVLLAWLGREALTDLLRQRLARELGARAGTPVRIDRLSLSFVPLRLQAAGIAVGTSPELLRISALDLALSPLQSLLERRIALTLRVDAPLVDLTHLPEPAAPQAAGQKPAGSTGVPPIDLRHVEITGARLRFPLGKSPATLAVARLEGELKTASTGSNVTASVEARGIEMHHKVYATRIDTVHAVGGADANGLFVKHATVKGEELEVEVDATDVAHRYAAVASFEPHLLGVFVDELALIGGRARVEGTLSGDLANPQLDARLSLPGAALAGRVLGDLTTRVIWEAATFQFEDVRLAGATGEATGDVTLTPVGDVPIRATLAWDRVDLEALLALIGTRLPLRDQLHATTEMQGTLDPLDLHITGTGTASAVNAAAGEPAAHWQATATVRPSRFEAQASLQQAEGNEVAAEVSITDGTFGGGVKLRAANVAGLDALLPQPLPGLAVKGHGEGTATFSGTVDHPVITGTLALREATIFQTPVSQLGGDFSIAAETLTTTGLRVRSGAGSAVLTGTLSLGAAADNRWEAQLQDLSTDLLVSLAHGVTTAELPVGGGTLSGTVRCRGTWGRPELHAELVAAAPRLFAEPLQQVALTATTALPEWQVQARATHVGAEALSIEAAGTGTARFTATFDGGPFTLANFVSAGRRRLGGTVSLHGRLSGALLQPDGVIDLSVTQLALRRRILGDGTIHAEGRGGSWTVTGTGLEGTCGIDGSVETKAPFPYRLAARWHDPPLARLFAADQALRVATTGKLDAAGSLSAPAASRGSLQVTDFHLTHGSYEVRSAAPIRLDLDSGRLQIRSFVLAAADSRFTLTGEATVGGLVDLEARGQGDLVLLELLGPSVTAARGPFSITARVRRTPGAPWELSGDAWVRDAVLDLGLPVAFTKTNGSFRLQGSTIQIDDLSGRVGGGTFRIGGNVDLAAGPRLTWSFTDVGLSPREGIEARIKGEGHVDGTWKAITARGGVEVLHALYDKNFGWEDVVPLLMAQIAPPLAPRQAAPTLPVALDLLVYSHGGVFVDNNLAQIEMWLDLHVTGTADSPIVSGTIGFLNGEVTFQGRKFTITGGTVDFRDRLRNNPVLNISAESRIVTVDGEYTIDASVTGTANDPRVQFSASDPSLSQTDVVSLVTFGKTTAEMQRAGGGVSAVDALALLPTSPVERQLGKLVGINQFDIQTTQSRGTGTVEPRVTIGKDLTDQLRAVVWTSFGVEQRHSVQLEYRLTPRISLLGSWESQTTSESGAFGGDINFHYEYRRLPFSLLCRDP